MSVIEQTRRTAGLKIAFGKHLFKLLAEAKTEAEAQDIGRHLEIVLAEAITAKTSQIVYEAEYRADAARIVAREEAAVN
jgi:hypothetical protein